VETESPSSAAPTKAIQRPSGDQAGDEADATSNDTWRSSCPSSRAIQMSVLCASFAPVRERLNASLRPSGDHVAPITS
jgi:hypothetical protein